MIGNLGRGTAIRGLILSCDVQYLHLHAAFHQDAILHCLLAFQYHCPLTVQELQDTATGHMDVVCDFRLARDPGQEPPQFRLVGHSIHFIGYPVDIRYDLQFLLLIDPDGHIQHQFQADTPLFPVKIRSHGQFLLAQVITYVWQHPFPAPMAVQDTAEGQGGLKGANRVVLPLSFIQHKQMYIPGHGKFLLHGLELHVSQRDIVPQDLENIGIVGGQGHFLLQPENIILADDNLGQVQGHPAELHLFLAVQGNGSLFIIKLLHPGR